MSTLHLHSATYVALLRRESLVGLGIHQLIKLLSTLLVDLDLDDPAAAIAIVLGDLVDGGGLLLQQHIALDDLALDGGVDVAGRLDGLDGANGVTGLDKVARGLRELDVRTAARGAKRITAGRATARKEQAIEAIVSGSVSGREDNG
ncbi:hypothetical protein E5D57_007747 [Metarhizium anisopliae]|nr:hypothetical protein E5D57_007747 [Metarhizium anisopliae]